MVQSFLSQKRWMVNLLPTICEKFPRESMNSVFAAEIFILKRRTTVRTGRWQKKCDIENVLKKLIGDHDTIVLQGEICGNQIQGNKYHINGYELFVFNLIYPDHKCTTAEIKRVLEPFGIKSVPIVEEGKKMPNTIAGLVEYSKGNSVVYNGQKREGILLGIAHCNAQCQ